MVLELGTFLYSDRSWVWRELAAIARVVRILIYLSGVGALAYMLLVIPHTAERV